MPRVVRTTALSSLAVTSAYASVPNHFAWLSPTAGSVLSPNDLLNASWTSSQRIISPSFSLCASSSSAPIPGSSPVASADLIQRRVSADQTPSRGDATSLSEPTLPTSDSPDDCGGAVWPNVSLDKTSGEYAALLSIPQLSSSSSFYLLMKSNLGDTYQSPAFDITAEWDAAEASPTTPPTTANGAPPVWGSTPLPPLPTTIQTPTFTQSSPRASGGPAQKPQPIGPILPPNFNPPSPSSAPSPTRSITPAEAAASAANKSGRMVATAVVVPLSLVALAAVAAATACFVIRRKKYEHQSVISAPSSTSLVSNYSANGDGFTMLPQRGCSLSKSNNLSEKFASTPTSSSEYLLPPLHQYQPYVVTPYTPYSVTYPPWQQPLAPMPALTGRPLSQPESVPIHLMSTAPALYPANQSFVRQDTQCQHTPSMLGDHTARRSHLGNIRTIGNPIVPRTIAADPAMPASQSREDSLISTPSETSPAAATHRATPVVLLSGCSKNQSVTPPSASGAGMAAQLTPPATDNTSLQHMTMQKVLNSYMARQADIEYRDSKPMPHIPFEPVDLDAARELGRKRQDSSIGAES